MRWSVPYFQGLRIEHQVGFLFPYYSGYGQALRKHALALGTERLLRAGYGNDGREIGVRSARGVKSVVPQLRGAASRSRLLAGRRRRVGGR